MEISYKNISFSQLIKQIKILTIDSYKRYLPEIENILAFSYAERGAMGLSGWIILVTNEGNVFGFDYREPTFSFNDINNIIPIFNKIIFDPGGLNNIVPEGWYSIYMGVGNHLFINKILYDRFDKIIIERNIKDYHKPDLQKNWIDIILSFISV